MSVLDTVTTLVRVIDSPAVDVENERSREYQLLSSVGKSRPMHLLLANNTVLISVCRGGSMYSTNCHSRFFATRTESMEAGWWFIFLLCTAITVSLTVVLQCR